MSEREDKVVEQLREIDRSLGCLGIIMIGIFVALMMATCTLSMPQH